MTIKSFSYDSFVKLSPGCGPSIAQFTHNRVYSNGSQTYQYKGTTLYINGTKIENSFTTETKRHLIIFGKTLQT